jgi:hypothetical protein
MNDTLLVSPSVAAVLGEDRADFAGGAVAVVGQRLDDDGDAARAVALVAHLVVVRVRIAAPPRLIARSIVSGSCWRRARRSSPPAARVRRRVGRPQPRRDVVISRIELGEDLRPHGVLRPLRCMMFLNWEWPAIADNQIR